MYLTAITLFLVGSLRPGVANSMYELAAFRAVQGLGAGGLMSLALAIIADMVSPRERSRYQGYFMAVFGRVQRARPGRRRVLRRCWTPSPASTAGAGCSW